MASKVLFSVPIESPAGGKIEASSIGSNIYLFKFIHAPDNRLTTPFCNAFLLALNILEFRYPPGVLIITSGIQKFFSNGFDLTHISQTPGFWDKTYFPMLRRLLVFPWPTIALVNGHAFGAGLFQASACDYRVMNPSRGFLCLPEVDMGAVIPTPIQAMFKQKIHDPAVYRTLVLEGARVPGKQALEGGIVDVLGGMEECFKLVESRKLLTKAQPGVWGRLKEDIFAESLASMDDFQATARWREGIEKAKDEEKEKALRAIGEWEKVNGKAKL